MRQLADDDAYKKAIRDSYQRALGRTPEKDALIMQLRAALKEALDGWDKRERDVWEDTGGAGMNGPFTVDPRSAELRKLVGE